MTTPDIEKLRGIVNADFFLQHETKYTQRWDHVEEHDDCYTWECSCGAIEESKFHSWDECHRHTREHWAEKLRELLADYERLLRERECPIDKFPLRYCEKCAQKMIEAGVQIGAEQPPAVSENPSAS